MARYLSFYELRDALNKALNHTAQGAGEIAPGSR